MMNDMSHDNRPSNVSDSCVTPDFYSYEWQPLISASLHDDFVEVAWADGASLSCYSLWLAENTLGMGLEPKTRESMIDPADLPDPGFLESAVVGENGELILNWADGRTTTAHPGWLRHVVLGRHQPASYLPAQEKWTPDSFSEPPSLDGSRVLEDPQVLRRWLDLIVRFGLARLRGTSVSEGFMRELAGRIGPIRHSNFGEVWSVRLVESPDSTAYTSIKLGQHTDFPTRETPPGFQFLHCVENTVAGGWSRMTDGLALVEELRSNHPDDYAALTGLKWVFFNRAESEDHRWVGPMIDHVDDDLPLTLRAFYPVRGFPQMDKADIPRAYKAMRRFSRLAHDERFQIRYPFKPGDVVGFDNRRVLHGRDAFDPGGGKRHLRGCYMDHDDLYSRLRVLNRGREGQSANE
jgi:gamma-butyrobetaine dioxygenase